MVTKKMHSVDQDCGHCGDRKGLLRQSRLYLHQLTARVRCPRSCLSPWIPRSCVESNYLKDIRKALGGRRTLGKLAGFAG